MRFEVTDDIWNRLQNANKPYLQRFFCNVDHLCGLRYRSRQNAVKHMKEAGFIVSVQKVKGFKDGTQTTCSISNLQKWCIFFNEPLDKMLSVDYSKEAQ